MHNILSIQKWKFVYKNVYRWEHIHVAIEPENKNLTTVCTVEVCVLVYVSIKTLRYMNKHKSGAQMFHNIQKYSVVMYYNHATYIVYMLCCAAYRLVHARKQRTMHRLCILYSYRCMPWRIYNKCFSCRS